MSHSARMKAKCAICDIDLKSPKLTDFSLQLSSGYKHLLKISQ